MDGPTHSGVRLGPGARVVGVGVILIIVGVAVILGLDKEFQTWFIENSPIRIWELDADFIPND